MARLLNQQTNSEILLHSTHYLGRGEVCHTRVQAPQISQIHALIEWRQGGWVLKDLNSSNGTTLNGRQLRSQQQPLLAGQLIVLGDVLQLVVVDIKPPQPFAVASDDRVVEGVNNELYLPQTEDYEAVILPEGGGDWLMTFGEEMRRVRDGDRVRVGGVHWTLALSVGTADTVRMQEIQPRYTLAETRLRFEVSQCETTVRVVACIGGNEIDLGTSAHNYMLLTLARQRLSDQAEDITSAERGWWYRDQLADGMRLGLNTLNVQICRARKSLLSHGWSDAQELVQRRSEGQVRLGVSELEIVRG